MFGWFKKRKKNAIAEAMNDANVDISRRKGAMSVCLRFIEFLDNNSLYQSLNIVAESESSVESLVVTMSSLQLLYMVRTGVPDVGDVENIIAIAKSSYIASNLMLNDKEVKDLLLMDSEEALNYLVNKKDIARNAWENWLIADLSTLESVVNA